MRATAIVAVLAGGRGRRLGGAKAAVPLAGRPLISYPLAAARAAGLEAVVVAKPDTPLPLLEAQVIFEPEQPLHPLCGVLAALEHAAAQRPPRAVVLSACDMPFLNGPLLEWLAEIDGPAMAQAGGRLQPLLARCEPEHRPALERALTERSSLTVAMSALDPRIVGSQELEPFGDPERLCFNVNDADELRLAESWLA
ncbi:MAG TPA: NTP transferase domain-containing protein [Solirubrobacteraceae bacterium]|jgi:molybdopterin-guanine dinucleotide biosynthesis protein A|nr:NTP transferase domain-containing protein [Solirubrobacteraceae bacterium]